MKYIFALLFLPFFAVAQNTESEEIFIQNTKDSLTLAGTLTLPTYVLNPPLAILISGSGQSDRDETIFKHKPFKAIAEYFQKQGIAVFRYDDRGGNESTGANTNESTSYQLSEDTGFILKHFKKDTRFANSVIGLIGHSEGGFIAPMVAARNENVAFLISMAGTAVRGKELLIEQNKAIFKTQGINNEAQKAYINELFTPSLDLIANSLNNDSTIAQIAELTETYRGQAGTNALVPAVFSSEMFAKRLMSQIGSPWGKYFINTDPAQFWSNVTCPVLALNGDKDVQVDMTTNTRAIKEFLDKAGNTQYEIKIMPNHNHLFQETENGSIMEYARLKEAISQEALQTMSDWILQL